MAKIQDGVPQLKGLKHSSVNFTNVYAWGDMGLDCLIGSAALMLPALAIGASGCVDGPPNVAPEIWVEIWNAHKAHAPVSGAKAQQRATKLTMLIREFGMHASIKALLSYRLGIDVGEPRRPTLPLAPAQPRTSHSPRRSARSRARGNVGGGGRLAGGNEIPRSKLDWLAGVSPVRIRIYGIIGFSTDSKPESQTS